MKPLFSFLFAILISCTAIAQPAITVRVDTNIAITNRNITTKTGARSITPLNVGYAVDSALELIRATAALVAGTGDLQAVTDLGPNTTNDIFIGAGSVGTPSAGWLISASGQYFSGLDGTTENIGLRATTGSAWIYMKDAGSGEFARIKAGSITAARTALMPDEGDGAGLDATLVLHTTANPITVGTTAGQHILYGTSTIQLKNVSTLNANLGSNTNGGFLLLRDAVSGFSSILKAPTTLTSADTSYLPPLTGVIACRRDTIGDAVSDMPSLVTESYLNAWTGGGANIANQALTANGNYTQDWNDKILNFTNVNNFTIKDTITTPSTYLLNLNDVTNFATSMIYANSNPALNQIRLVCVDGFTKILMQGTATRSLTATAGTAAWNMTQTSTVCNATVTAGGAAAAILTVDSITNNVKVGHLGGSTNAPTIAAGTGAGTSPTVSIGSGSTDLSGYINVTTGTTCATSSAVVTITFTTAYAAAPKCVIISPANALTAGAVGSRQVHVDQATGITTTTFILTSGTTALTNASNYQWYYMVIQ